MSTVVELSGVSVAFPRAEALVDLSLGVRAGERVALVGPSGAGKSTLLGLCTSAVLASRGTVKVFGEDPAAISMSRLQFLRRRISVVPQHLGLVGELRVVENLLAANPRRHRWWQVLRDLVRAPEAEVAMAFEILETLGVQEKIFLPVHSLSGGEMQRVAVARALFRRPQLVLADEPVSSVDPSRARDVLRVLLSETQDSDRTWIVSLHQPELATEHFDRIVGLREGRVLFDLSAARVDASHWARLYRGAADDDGEPR